MFTDAQLKRKLDELRTTEDALLENASPEGYRDWSRARRSIAVQQLVLMRLGFDPGKIDGLVGPQTTFAFELARSKDPEALGTFKDDDKGKKPLVQPKSNVWPKQSASSMDKFFGAKGTNQGSLKLPFPMRIAWAKDQTITKMTLNKKVIESAGRVFEKSRRAMTHPHASDLEWSCSAAPSTCAECAAAAPGPFIPGDVPSTLIQNATS